MIAVVHAWSLPNPLDLFQSGVKTITQDAAQAVFNGFCRWVAAGADSLIKAVVALLKPGSWVSLVDPNPTIKEGWFQQRMSVMLKVSALVVLPLVLFATIGAVLRQDARRLARVWGVALPAAILGGFATVSLTSEALKATDALCSAITSGLSADVAGALTRVGLALVAVAQKAPFVALLAAIVAVAGALFIWLELVVRSAAIDLAVFFVPLALAGLVWPATAHWTKRHLELLAALIASKFVIVASLTLAIGAVGQGESLGAVMAGAAILLLAAFAPFVLLRLAPVVEAAAIAHLEGVSRRPFRAAERTASLAESPLFALAMKAAGVSGVDGIAGQGGGGGGGRGGGGTEGGGHGGGGHGGGGGPGGVAGTAVAAAGEVADNVGGQLERDLVDVSSRAASDEGRRRPEPPEDGSVPIGAPEGVVTDLGRD